MACQFLIKSSKVFIDGKFETGLNIAVSNGFISSISETKTDSTEIIDLTNLTLLPGFIDIHTHGGNGFDAMDGTHHAVREVSKHKLREGVTSFCPTTMTAPVNKINLALEAAEKAAEEGMGAKIIGVFVEGPFISEKYKGAHPSEFIMENDELAEFLSKHKNIISVAIAPEKAGSISAIEEYTKKGINFRLGHTGATYAEAEAAISAGGNIAIHTYNAMSPLTHREPGMVGAVLNDDRVYAELICDGIHIAPEAMQVLYKCKGRDKIILITDSMCAAGCPDGDYNLGELPVTVRDGIARTLNGALAGSTVTMNMAVKNMIELVKVPVEHAIDMATINPARALGLENVGLITEGYAADLIAVDDVFNVRFVMIDGKIKINKN